MTPVAAPAPGRRARARQRASYAAIVVAASLTALTSGSALSQISGTPAAPTEPDRGATAEALLARGLAHSGGSELKLGLDELRLSVERRGDWRPAREALGVALLRSGSFEEAGDQFAAALGPALAESLETGAAGITRLRQSDANALFGLAVSRHMAGHLRRAERLYRLSADLAGTTSPGAARAYYRLHELFRLPEAAWGDQAAELEKAVAIDPEIASRVLLPDFPDAASLADLRPYLVPIALLRDPGDSTAYDAPPALASWTSLADSTDLRAALERGEVPVEILVDVDGVPLEAVIEGDWAGDERAVESILAWRFTPATAGGETVTARIRYGEGH